MSRKPYITIRQPRFDAGNLPDPLAGDKRCLQINKEWIPMIIGNLWWMRGPHAWNGTEEEVELAVQYTNMLMEHLAAGVTDGCEGTTPETECCTEYPANHPVIQYAPNDPWQTPHLTPPGGYHTPPWKEFSSFAQALPNTQEGDAIVPITAFPFGIAEPFDPENLLELITVSGFPRFKFRFTGSGTIQLHLLKFPLGGMCYITHDGNPLTGKVVSTESLDLDEILPLLALTGIAPLIALAHVVQDEIIEIEIEGDGDHYLDCTFLPRMEVVAIVPLPIAFGGGLRKIVVCGNIQAQEIPDMQMRVDGCEWQWRPNDNTGWETLGNLFEGLNLSAISIPYGNNPTLELTDCNLQFGIPEGGQGIQGEQGPQGEQGEQGVPGEDASCEWYFAQPDNLDYFCRGAYVASLTLVHEIFQKLSVYGDFVDPMGELFVSAIPLSMRDMTTYHSLGIDLVGTVWGVPEVDFLNLHYEDNYPLDSVGTTTIQCRLFNYFYADPTLESFQNFGASLSGEQITDPLHEAMENPGNSEFIQEKITEFFFRCIARLYFHWNNPLRTTIYYESNLSCPDGVMDCADCIPPATWCNEFDFTTDDHGFLPGFENERAEWFSGFGWQISSVDTDVIAIKYNFADEITLTQVTIFIDTPLEGDQNHWYAAFGEYNSLNVFATDDTATEKANTTPGHLTGSGDFLMYVDKNAGNNSGVYAGSITKVRFEGTGENPFSTSNC